MTRSRKGAELLTAYESGGLSQFKNRIINGAMMIDQRNAGASVTASTTGSTVYTIDRWAYAASQASKFTVQQNAGAVTPPAGFVNYLGATSSAVTTVGAADYFTLIYNIEGYNIADIGFGLSAASQITLSFWVRSSLTGTFGGAFNNGGTRSYAYSYTINAANTWEFKTVTLTADTTGTWNKTNGNGCQITFSLGHGSNSQTAAGSWAAGNYAAPTGATSVVGTNGATFYITGVQLEKGSTATSFDYRPYPTELALCQRYCEIATPVSSVYVWGSGNNQSQGAYWKVEKRASPTVTVYGVGGYPNSPGSYDRDGVGNTAFNFVAGHVNGFKVGLTSGYSGQCGYKGECEI